MNYKNILLLCILFSSVWGCTPENLSNPLDEEMEQKKILVFADPELLSNATAKDQLFKDFNNSLLSKERICPMDIQIYALSCATTSELPLALFEIKAKDAKICKVGKRKLYEQKTLFKQAINNINIEPQVCNKIMESLEVIQREASTMERDVSMEVIYYSRMLEINERMELTNYKLKFLKNNKNGDCFEMDEVIIAEVMRHFDDEKTNISKYLEKASHDLNSKQIRVWSVLSNSTFYREKVCEFNQNLITQFWKKYFNGSGLEYQNVTSISNLTNSF